MRRGRQLRAVRRSGVRLHGGGLGGLQGRFTRRLRAGPANQRLPGWLLRGGPRRLPAGLRRTQTQTQTDITVTSQSHHGRASMRSHLARGRPGRLAGGVHEGASERLLRGPPRGTAQEGLPTGGRRRAGVRAATGTGKGLPAGLRAGSVSGLHSGRAAHITSTVRQA